MSTLSDPDRLTPAGLERLASVLDWWLGPDTSSSAASDDYLYHLRETTLQLQEVMRDCACSQLDCWATANRRLVSALAKLAQTPTLRALMAEQAEITTILMETTAVQLRAAAHAADRTHRCCATLAEVLSAETEVASAGTAAPAGRIGGAGNPAQAAPPEPTAMQAATGRAGGSEGRP